MGNFLVSIIVATRSEEKVLARCLGLIKGQTYKNIEIIVVDRDSPDRTKKIAQKYTNKVYNFGPERSAQRNYGVRKAKGEYVLIIDADMELSKNVVRSCVEKVVSDKQIKAVIIPEESFGEGFWAQCKKLERSFYQGIDWIEAARFFNKTIFLKVGGYDESLVSGEDWDLSEKVGEQGKIGRVRELVFHNEGKINLLKTMKKKFYYAQEFSKYANKNHKTNNINRQTGLISRYWLFLSKPVKLFRNPVLGLGMLFMKTCEFGMGFLGYLQVKIKGENR